MLQSPSITAPVLLPHGKAIIMDEQEFRLLYDMTARPLWAYLMRVSGRADLADDVLQETYCRFLLRNPSPMQDRQTRTYLFRIATNLLHDRWRSRQDTSWYEPPLDELPERYATAAPHDLDTQIDVHAVLQHLKPRERELLWLAYVEGMTHNEIASATGLNPMGVRLLLFRARRRAAGLLRPAARVKP